MDYLFIFFLGLEFGSFANVCIYRWPLDKSILRPLRSHCPQCDHQIAWWENIPVLSYLFLKGKCSSCKTAISPRYPLIELSLPALWIGTYWYVKNLPLHFPWLFWGLVFFLLFVLLVTTVTDLDWKIIPDNATFPLLAVGIICAPWNPFFGSGSSFTALSSALLGAAAGAGVLLAVAVVGKIIFSKEAMGGGDIKLLAGFGAVLGWKGALAVLFLGSFLGGVFAIFGLLSGRLKRKQHIPFGPFLNLGALVVFLWMCRLISIGAEPSAFSF